MTRMRGRVLIVAGSDSGGGAGIQADIKTVTALQGFATTAVTALTAQNTLGVHGVHLVPPAFVAQQIAVVLDDLGADAIKTGMLHDATMIETVVAALARAAPDTPLVVDPVMVAKGGQVLLEPTAVAAMRQHLLPRATVLTPNLPEAESLLGAPIAGLAERRAAGEALLALGPRAVLMKGGHAPGPVVHDILVARGPDGHVAVTSFESGRVATAHTHGTGCTLAAAIACGLAQGLDLVTAVDRARRYVLQAIATAPGFGAGHGPLDHAHTVAPF